MNSWIRSFGPSGLNLRPMATPIEPNGGAISDTRALHSLPTLQLDLLIERDDEPTKREVRSISTTQTPARTISCDRPPGRCCAGSTGIGEIVTPNRDAKRHTGAMERWRMGGSSTESAG